jgi:choline dehydrogenase-like flavoprotein
VGHYGGPEVMTWTNRTALALVFSSYLIDIAPSFPTKEVRIKPGTVHPTFENQNGRMMEGSGGTSIFDLRVRNGCRQSVFRSYVFPHMDRPNLTVLTGALVTRLTFDRHERNRVTGVEFSHEAPSAASARDPKWCCRSVRSTPPRC